MEDLRRSFGLRVRILRLRVNLTQAELAERAELSEDQIGNIERGKSWTGELTVRLLARALQVNEQSLFDFGENGRFISEGGMIRRAIRKRRSR